MAKILLSLLFGLLLLSGCASVDQARVTEQLAAAEAKVAQIEKFISENQPVVEQLGKLAADTKDPTLIAAAEKLRSAVALAVANLPTAKQELATIKTTVEQLQADAEGKVPWYAIAGGLALHYVPRIAAMVFPQLAPLAALFANMNWSLSATRKQKDEDEALAEKAKEA